MLNLTAINQSGLLNNSLASFGEKSSVSLFQLIGDWCYQLDNKIVIALLTFYIFKIIRARYRKPLSRIWNDEIRKWCLRIIDMLDSVGEMLVLYVIVYAYYQIGFNSTAWSMVVIGIVLFVLSFFVNKFVKALNSEYNNEYSEEVK